MSTIFGIAKRYKGEANYAVSNVVTSVVSMLSGIIAAAFIAPEDLGVIQSFLLVQTYTTFLNFGVFSGLNRNIAYYKAKGDLDIMQSQIDTSHSVSVVVAIMGALISIGIIIYHIAIGSSPVYIWSGALLLVTLVFSPITTHIECTFRSGQQFGRFGWIKNVQGGVYAIASLLPILLGYIGRVLSNAFNLIFGYILRLKYLPIRHKGIGNLSSLKDLITTGLPIMISGYILSIFQAVDRTYIAAYMTSYDMGLYAIAGYCSSIIYIIPAAVGTMLYPKATAKYGETGDKRDLIPFWRKSMILYFAILFPIMVVAYFSMPYLVELFMPKYIGGVVVGKIAIITSITLVSNGPCVIFGTLKKNAVYMAFVTLCLGLFWLIVTIFHGSFKTIESVAMLKCIIAILLAIFTVSYSYWLIRK